MYISYQFQGQGLKKPCNTILFILIMLDTKYKLKSIHVHIPLFFLDLVFTSSEAFLPQLLL